MRGSKFPADMHNYLWCPIYIPSFMIIGSVVSEELRWQDFGTDGRTDRRTDGQTDGVTALLDLLSPSATQVKFKSSSTRIFCAKFDWMKLAKLFWRRKFRQCIFGIPLLSPLGKWWGPLFEQTWTPFTPRMVCAKYGWNWHNGFWEEEC